MSSDFWLSCGAIQAFVVVALSWINWATTTNQLPKITKEYRHRWLESCDLVQSIKKSKRWRDYVARGANSLNEQEMKGLATSPIRSPDGRIVKSWLRDKVCSMLMCRKGFHPIDVTRVKLENIELNPNHHNQNGHHQPFLKINGHKTKQHGIPVTHILTCGCEFNHDETNENCEYFLFTN